MSQSMEQFKQDLKFGELKELEAKEAIEKTLVGVAKVEKVNYCDNPRAQELGHDLLVHRNNGSTYTVSVKSNRQSDNLVLEIIGYDGVKQGWLFLEDADYIMWMLQTREPYIASFELVKQAYFQNAHKWSPVHVKKSKSIVVYVTPDEMTKAISNIFGQAQKAG